MEEFLPAGQKAGGGFPISLCTTVHGEYSVCTATIRQDVSVRPEPPQLYYNEKHFSICDVLYYSMLLGLLKNFITKEQNGENYSILRGYSWGSHWVGTVGSPRGTFLGLCRFANQKGFSKSREETIVAESQVATYSRHPFSYSRAAVTNSKRSCRRHMCVLCCHISIFAAEIRPRLFSRGREGPCVGGHGKKTGETNGFGSTGDLCPRLCCDRHG